MKHGEKYKIQLLEDPSIRNPYAIRLDKILEKRAVHIYTVLY
jgi:hypothetical protein